jgi:hypothetical protein
MPIISLIIILVVIGVILWLVNTKIPMDSTIKAIINVVVLIAVLVWLLSVFGVIGSIDTVKVPKLK